MPFYANGTRVDLNSASSLYSPADSSGAACNLTSGTATPFYANGSQIYITTASWHTIWTGTVNGIIKGTNRSLNLTASGTFTTGTNYRVTLQETSYNLAGGAVTIESANMPTTFTVQIGKVANINSLTVTSSTITLAINTGTAKGGIFQMQKVEAYY